MFDLSTKQDNHSSSTNPTLPHHYRTRSTPIPTGLHGPYHGFTPCPRLRRHTHHCGSRMLPERCIPTLFHHHHRGGNCPAIPRTRIPMVRPSKEGDHGSRPSLHIAFRKGTRRPPRYPAESVNRFPSPN